MQLPVAFLFGYLTDFAVWAVRGIQCHTYWQQWIVCLAGIFLVAVGVSLEVKAGVVVLAGEGVVLAICQVLPIKFGYMKVGFDVTLVLTACILSLVFTQSLQGGQGRNRCRCPSGRTDCKTSGKNMGEISAGRSIKTALAAYFLLTLSQISDILIISELFLY